MSKILEQKQHYAGRGGHSKSHESREYNIFMNIYDIYI